MREISYLFEIVREIIEVRSVVAKQIKNKIGYLRLRAFNENSSSQSTFGGTSIIFDNMTFNQDIYITHKDDDGGQPINYYIELEQVKLDLNENTVATLKDIKNIEASYL